jgi:hypothetical protein
MRVRIKPADWPVLVAEMAAVAVLFLAVAAALVATADGEAGKAVLCVMFALLATVGLVTAARGHGVQRGRREVLAHLDRQAAHRDGYGPDRADQVDEVRVSHESPSMLADRYGLPFQGVPAGNAGLMASGREAADGIFGEPRPGPVVDTSPATAAAEVPAELERLPDSTGALIVMAVNNAGERGLSKREISERLAELGQPMRNSGLVVVLDRLVDAGELYQWKAPYGRYRSPQHAGQG